MTAARRTVSARWLRPSGGPIQWELRKDGSGAFGAESGDASAAGSGFFTREKNATGMLLGSGVSKVSGWGTGGGKIGASTASLAEVKSALSGGVADADLGVLARRYSTVGLF
jgi:hypothetical protein